MPRRDRSEVAHGATNDENCSETQGLLPPIIHQVGQTITVSGPGRIERFLRQAHRETPPVDGMIVLTTERSATELLRSWKVDTASGNRAAIGIIDTRSKGQYIADIYRRIPIHYTTADGDIERTAISLTELVESLSTTPAQRFHLVVDSYTAFSGSLAPEERAQLLKTFHSQIDGYQLYVTDGSTYDSLDPYIDGMIWVEDGSDETVRTRYQRF